MITTENPTQASGVKSPLAVPAASPQAPTVDVVNVVVVYESYPDGVRVRDALDRIALASSYDLRFDIRAWDFETIRAGGGIVPDISHADGADCMVISAACDVALPAALARWVEGCVADNANGPAVMVGMCGDDSDPLSPLHRSVSLIAAKWHLQYLGGAEFEQAFDRSFSHNVVTRRAAGIGRFIEACRVSPGRYERAGINE